jgi:sec-independent protein translocase protein TatA
MPKIGTLELVIVLVIVLLIFGVGRLGRLGKDLGEGIREFRQSIAGNEDKSEEEADTAEKQG